VRLVLLGEVFNLLNTANPGDAFIVFTIVNTLNLFPRLRLESELFQHYYSAAREGTVYFCKARIA
jgi:hypothetical protein